MKLIYIAGPYRANSAWEVENHIRTAEIAGAILAQRGYVPVIPHTMYRFFDGLAGVSGQFWIDATLELMGKCDAVFCVGTQGYAGESEGTVGELETARAMGMPIYWSMEEVP